MGSQIFFTLFAVEKYGALTIEFFLYNCGSKFLNEDE